MNIHHFSEGASAAAQPDLRAGTAGDCRGDSPPPWQCTVDSVCHQLLFASLYHPGRGFAVPCDAGGHVDLDALPKRLLTSYLGARAMIGREYAYPVVQRVH